MLDVKVNALTLGPPSLYLKYSPLKPKDTVELAAICGYKATPLKPPPSCGALQVAALTQNLNASVIW